MSDDGPTRAGRRFAPAAASFALRDGADIAPVPAPNGDRAVGSQAQAARRGSDPLLVILAACEFAGAALLPALTSQASAQPTGHIVGWGELRFKLPAPNAGFRAIAAGGREVCSPFQCWDYRMVHCLALRADGSIAAWGGNNFGQCNIPAPNAGFVAIDAGGAHSLGLRADGTVWAWGDNSLAQCDVPPPNAGFTAIAAGLSHSLGLKADGSVVAWGHNNSGQCVVAPPNTGFTAVAAGGGTIPNPVTDLGHSFGLRSDGSIGAWGCQTPFGNLGQCNVPPPNARFVAVAAGGWHNLGLRADGSIAAWGANNFGQCAPPVPNSGFVAIAAGEVHSLGLKADGSIIAWGRNNYGQCTVPAPNSGFIAIAAGMNNSLALRTDSCYPDCDKNAALTVADFGCFQTRFVQADLYADCNADGQLTAADFGCFQTKFVAGCP